MAGPSFLDTLKAMFAPPPDPMPTPEPMRAPPAPAPPLPPPPPLELARVPASAKQRVETIRTLVAELQARAAAQKLGNDAQAELAQIGTLYLPRLLQSYAEIPAEHRAEIFRDTGHSASFLLGERLDKIIDRLHEISRAAARGDLDAFSDNMRFIDSRYGPGSSPFD